MIKRLTNSICVDDSRIEMVRVSNPSGELEIQFLSGRSLFLSGGVAKEALRNLQQYTTFGVMLSGLKLGDEASVV